MTHRRWGIGDRVIHAAMPEWGSGEVRAVESVLQDGRPAQRLTIRFDRAGVKVLSSPPAELREAPALAPAPETSDSPSSDADLLARLTSLPDDATDPFRSPLARLQTTLALYRFNESGASLLDWAASRSGLKDPLARFSRHELEGFFQRFRGALDAHLRRLLSECRRQEPAAVQQLLSQAPPAARQAVRRLDLGR